MSSALRRFVCHRALASLQPVYLFRREQQPELNPTSQPVAVIALTDARLLRLDQAPV